MVEKANSLVALVIIMVKLSISWSGASLSLGGSGGLKNAVGMKSLLRIADPRFKIVVEGSLISETLVKFLLSSMVGSMKSGFMMRLPMSRNSKISDSERFRVCCLLRNCAIVMLAIFCNFLWVSSRVKLPILNGMVVDEGSFWVVKRGAFFSKVESSGRNVVGKSIESNKVVSSLLQTPPNTAGENLNLL